MSQPICGSKLRPLYELAPGMTTVPLTMYDAAGRRRAAPTASSCANCMRAIVGIEAVKCTAKLSGAIERKLLRSYQILVGALYQLYKAVDMWGKRGWCIYPSPANPQLHARRRRHRRAYIVLIGRMSLSHRSRTIVVAASATSPTIESLSSFGRCLAGLLSPVDQALGCPYHPGTASGRY